MAKILLLNPPGTKLFLRDQHCSSVSKADYYWPPIDLLMLSGTLASEYEVTVLDALIERLNEETTLKRISENKPDFIVFITGTASWVEDLIFMEKVKKKTGAILIGSGGILKNDYQNIMERFWFVDAIIMDYTSKYILDYLNGANDLFDICFRQGEEIILKPFQDLKIFSVPTPLHELFPLKKYRIPHGRYRPFVSMLTSYGCPYKCSYCIAERIDFKYRPLDNIIPELEKIVSMGIKEIFFKDFTFGIPKEVTKVLCEEMVLRFPRLSWICSSRVNVLDEELLKLMKQAGCHTIQFGVESASQEVLDSHNKKIVIEEVIKAFNLCHKLGIKTLAHFILGLPGETEETLELTVELAKKIKCDYASFNVAVPIPGTTLRQKCEENNWIVGEPEEMDSSKGYPVIETPVLSREKLWDFRNRAIKSFYLRPYYILQSIRNTKNPHDFVRLVKDAYSLLIK